MTTAPVTKNEVVQPTPMDMVIDNKFIDGLTAQLEEKKQFGLTFPPDYNPTNALTGAYLVLKETNDKNGKCVLDSCSRPSIANALMDMVTLGVSVQKKQAYFIPYGNKLQLQVSVHGKKAIAHRCGVGSIDAEVIYEGDVFKYHIENGRKVFDSHEQDFMNIDLTKVKGAYVVLSLADGSHYMEVMNIGQIKTAWKKGYGYKEGSGTHAEFTDMMAKKTVIKRATNNFIQQYGDNYVLDSFDRTQDSEELDKTALDVANDLDTEANNETFIDADTTVIEAPVTEKPKADKKFAVSPKDEPDFA